jgi:hypothetical protein
MLWPLLCFLLFFRHGLAYLLEIRPDPPTYASHVADTISSYYHTQFIYWDGFKPHFFQSPLPKYLGLQGHTTMPGSRLPFEQLHRMLHIFHANGANGIVWLDYPTMLWCSVVLQNHVSLLSLLYLCVCVCVCVCVIILFGFTFTKINIFILMLCISFLGH